MGLRIELQSTIKKKSDGSLYIVIPQPIKVLGDLNKRDSITLGLDRRNRIIIKKNKKSS